jgi:gamma-glutamylputrescine oxidase
MLLDSDTQLNQTSYYEDSVQRPPLEPALQGDVVVDVVVVGAGYAGLTSAIELARRGYKVAVLEAERICSGASGRNGGQAIAGYASGQGPFEAQLGKDLARQAWDMSMQSIDVIDRHIRDFDIACDRVKGYMYVADSPRKARALEEDCEAMQRDYGFSHEFVRGSDVQRFIQSPRYCAAAFESTSGHLHPLKFGLGLARAAKSLGVTIYEKSPVIRLDRGQNLCAYTVQGQVHANYAVLAGNCTLPEYGPKVAPELTPRIMPVGTYMISTKPLSEALCRTMIPSNAAACDNNFILDYFRFSADHRMLFGGRVSYSTRTPARLKQVMAKRLGAIFPQLKDVAVEHVWGGFVDISMNRAPDFGRVADNVYYLQGFSGHGVALTCLGGELAAQAIAGQAERFDVFAKLKHRQFPGGPLLRTPSLILGTLYHRLMDLI